MLTTHKLAKLESLAIYWNTDSELLSTSGTDIVAAFTDIQTHKKSLTQRGNRNQYILKPVSGEGRITIHKGSPSTIANSKAELFFDEIGFVLDEYQYRDALMMVDLFHFYVRTEQFKNLRPTVSVEENPRAWFKFAGNVILREIHEKNRQWSWEYFKERRDDRKRYIELYKIDVVADTNARLTDAQKNELAALHFKLSLEDLRFYRSLAKAELRKERRKVKALEAQTQATQQEGQPKRGWMAWAWGSPALTADGGTSPTKESATDDSAVMTDQQRKELYDAIEWDEEKKPAAEMLDLPRDAVKIQLKLFLGMGSFALKRDPRGAASEILQLVFDTFSMDFLQRPDSFLVDLSLEELKVHDGTTKDSLYPDMVRVKRSAQPAPKSHPRIMDLTDSMEIDNESEAGQPSDPFFHLQFEKNPLDESADSTLMMKTGGMEIYYNKTFIEEITQFFKPPKTHMESFGALLYAAGATVEGITNQTRAGLEYALQEHKTLNAKLDIQAPLIILPSSATERNAPCMVVDAGHINIVSNLVDKAVIREVQSKQSTQYQEEDYETLKSLMYDRFQINLESTQVLVGPNVEDTIMQLHESKNQHKYFHILDKITMSLLVEISIVAKATNLTKFRVSGHLPVLHVSMSDVKYKILMHLINSSIPNMAFLDVDDSMMDQGIPPEETPARPNASRIESSSSQPTHKQSKFRFSSSGDSGHVQEISALIAEDEDENDDDDDDTFVEADDETGHVHGSDGRIVQSRANTSNEASYEQRMFEFKFTVDKVQGSLYRGGIVSGSTSQNVDEDFTASHLLVDVILEHFEFMFYNRAYDMHAEIILSKLTVEDKIEANPSPEFSRLISSDSYYGGDTSEKTVAATKETKNLFHVTYSKVQKESPEYMSTFEGIDQSIDVSISTLNFVITRKSILTLLDFVQMMFSDDAEKDSDQLVELAEDSDSETETASTIQSSENGPDKMKLKMDLSSIALILNDDGVRLATIRIDQADIGLFTMGKTMRVGGRIGNFSLQDHAIDEETGNEAENQLVSIQGDELADFRYETFDPKSLLVSYPGYNSSIYFRSGSIEITFVEESFQRILQFLAKFAEMKSLYDSAREAAVQQASQMKDPDKIHFDVIVRTPIFVFSRDCPYDSTEGNVRSDVVTVHLGELYIQNDFSNLENPVTGRPSAVNKINAGLRQTRISSVFHFPDDVVQELQMIENLDIIFKMVYVEHTRGVDRPALEIVGSMSDVNLKLTESQYIFLINFLKSLSATFQAPPPQDDDAAENMRTRAIQAASAEPPKRRTSKSIVTGSKGGSIKDDRTSGKSIMASDKDTFTKMDFVFRLQTLSLELFKDTDTDVIGPKPASLSKLSFDGTDAKLRMKSDDSIESEFHVKSFTIFDSRQNQKNKFREIVPPIKHDGCQFMASVSTMKNDQGATDMIAILSIDSPRFIFAIDYIFSLKAFFVDSLQIEEDDSYSDSDDSSETETTRVGSSSKDVQVAEDAVTEYAAVEINENAEPVGSLSFRINIVDASVILIANPLSSSSEAIVLRIKEIMLTQQNAFTLSTRQVGIYLCRMDLFEENRLRILDDFNLIFSIDNNHGGIQHKTSINVGVDALVLRISLRDILLALSIVNKASELSPEITKPVQRRPYSRFSSNKRLKQLAKKPKPSTAVAVRDEVSTQPRRSSSIEAPVSTLLRSEELTADLDGLRLVLIGGIHELPLLDMCIKQFPIHVRNWSSEMDADTSIEMFVNVYNYSKSAWEPLIEPWYLGFHMTRTIEPATMAINFNSRKTLEVTVTTQTIAMLSNAVEMISGDSDLLSKPPDANAPYRIKNQTGYTLQVWVDNTDNSEFSLAKEIADGEEVPWRFDDWRKLREV